MWGPLHEGGNPNLSLGFQDLSHQMTVAHTGIGGCMEEGYRHPSGPVLVTFAFYRPDNAQVYP